MKKSGLIASVAVCIAVAILAAAGTSSRAANPPAPTPLVSVTTLPPLPSPGAPTAHPVSPPPVTPLPGTPAPATTVPPLAAPTAPPGQTPAPNATLGLPAPGTAITISGLVKNPQILTLEQLTKLPSTSLTMRVVDADGKHHFHTFTGTAVKSVIEYAVPTNVGGTSTSTTAYVLVEGVYGKSAIVGFPEFEPDFNGKHVFLAYTVDGRAAPMGTAMLVIEGDATSGRFVQGVTRLIVVDPVQHPNQ